MTELLKILPASESTLRRDIAELDRLGLVRKVFGGAVSFDNITTKEASVVEKSSLFVEEKKKIAKAAAKLVVDYDFVYLDAGTTTEFMIEFITANSVRFVTNGLSHGKKLAELGFETMLLGGLLKTETQGILGGEAILNLQKFHFTKGFFGTNGVHPEVGFTTADSNEAATKSAAMAQCRHSFVLADSSKIPLIAGVSFATMHDARLFTSKA